MHGDFAAGCIVEIEANLNKVGEIERCNPAVKDPCRNGKDQLEAGITQVIREVSTFSEVLEEAQKEMHNNSL